VLKATLDLTQETYAWQLPDTLTLAQVRLVTSTAAFPSPVFAIAPRLLTQFGYVCPSPVAPTGALLNWSALPGVARYQVYELRDQYLEPLAQTPDTTLLLSQAQLGVRYYAVAPILNGVLLEPGRTVDYNEAGIGCYIRSFQPRAVAADTVQLNLTLGSVYRLQSATLERLAADGSYQPVHLVQPVAQLEITFTDPSPRPGGNTYRAHLRDLSGASYYSQPETVQFVMENELQVYPNPIQAGGLLQVVQGGEGLLHLQLYDLSGRLVREATEEGQLKLLDTRTLRKGLYLLRTRTAAGWQLTRRVVVL
jgi:hypothetical protein